MSIRILLADDHSLMLDGLRALLQREPGLEVVGAAKDGKEAVELARRTSPDVVVMDISMPGLNGIAATSQITAELPGVKVICLSMHAEPRFVEAMLEAGAAGYILKDYALEDLVKAIHLALAGDLYLCPRIGGTVVRALRADGPRRASAFALLTGREREILQLIAEGHSTKEIAGRLHLSIKTIGSHRENLMRKIGIDSVARLTKYAIQEGLTSATP
jgi:DNA-binding NarL/FixJ family response regulator